MSADNAGGPLRARGLTQEEALACEVIAAHGGAPGAVAFVDAVWAMRAILNGRCGAVPITYDEPPRFGWPAHEIAAELEYGMP